MVILQSLVTSLSRRHQKDVKGERAGSRGTCRGSPTLDTLWKGHMRRASTAESSGSAHRHTYIKWSYHTEVTIDEVAIPSTYHRLTNKRVRNWKEISTVAVWRAGPFYSQALRLMVQVRYKSCGTFYTIVRTWHFILEGVERHESLQASISDFYLCCVYCMGYWMTVYA